MLLIIVTVRFSRTVVRGYSQLRTARELQAEVAMCISTVCAFPEDDSNVVRLRVMQESLARSQTELSPSTFNRLAPTSGLRVAGSQAAARQAV